MTVAEPLPHEPVSYQRRFNSENYQWGCVFTWGDNDGWEQLAIDLALPEVIETHVTLANGQTVIVRAKP
jgi:hypothetical protein